MERQEFDLSREDYNKMLSANINDPNRINQWELDESFLELKKDTNSLVDDIRLYILYQLANYAKNLLEGDVAEVGVFRGGTAKILANVFTPTTLHLFDTFEGMPKVDESVDFHKEGDFKASFEEVQNYLSTCNNVKFYKGLFPKTARPVQDKTFCFVHIDVDIYSSIYESCEFFYPRLEKGGIILSDDYGCITCAGAKKGMDDYFIDKPETPIYLPRGQAFIIKL